MNNKMYIGDGVYAEYDGYYIWLKANNPNDPTDKIALLPEMLDTLQIFYERQFEDD